MELDFSGTFARFPLLMQGALLSVDLAAVAMLLGTCIGLACATLKLLMAGAFERKWAVIRFDHDVRSGIR